MEQSGSERAACVVTESSFSSSSFSSSSSSSYSFSSSTSWSSGYRRQSICIRTIYVVVLLFITTLDPTCAQTASNPIRYELMEDLLPGSVVGNIKSDAGLNEKYSREILDSLTFGFLTAEEIKDYFTMDDATGNLLTARVVDRDVLCPGMERCVQRLDIGVQPAKYFQTIKVDIDVLDVNDNSPQFVQDHMNYELSEGTPTGTLFPISLAVDADSPKYGVKRYELISSTSKFELKTQTLPDGTLDLHLSLQEPFDREKEDFYKLQVVAKDGGVPSKNGILTLDVSVLDVNDNSPKFINDTFRLHVSENMLPDSIVGVIRAVDRDQGINGEIVYSFASTTQRQHGGTFRINPVNGELQILESLDYERQKYYSLVVVAQDKGPDALPSSVRVELHVHDENDNAPEIIVNSMTNTGMVQVHENEPADTFVAHISIIDQDDGDNGRIICTLDDLHFKLFEMLDKEFKILTAVELDREDIAQYKIHIRCNDMGIPRYTATTELLVTVIDTNDHSPQFLVDRYEVEIAENNKADQFLMQVQAHDNDIGDNGQVSYELGRTGGQFFTVDPQSGAVSAQISFDRERRRRYEFQIRAKDNGKPEPKTTTTTVVVRILDVDDEPPKFVQNKYTFSVYENQPIGTEVGQVLATDKDLPPNNKFSFYLDGVYTPVDVFRIDPVSGVIYTKAPLDRERQEIYHLTAIAQSDNVPGLSDMAQIEVFVTDRNDNQPQITFPTPKNNTIWISNQLPYGYILTQVTAKDPDFAENGELTYIISEGARHAELVISPETGKVVVNTDLSGYPTNHTFSLIIMVKDNGEPQKMSIETLNVVVNRSMPVTYHANVGENTSGARSGAELDDTLLAIIVGAGCGIMIMITAIILAICLLLRQKRRSHRGRKYYSKPPVQQNQSELKVVEKKKESHCNGSSGSESLMAIPHGNTYVGTNNVSDVSFALMGGPEPCNINKLSGPYGDGHNLSAHTAAVTDTNGIGTLGGGLGGGGGAGGPGGLHITGQHEKDSDSGCYADLSHTDSQGSNDETMQQGANPGNCMGHRGHHSHLHHHPPHRSHPPPPHPSPVSSRPPHPDPSSPTFSDWVHAEGQNLKRKGNVYRVANATAKKFPNAQQHHQQQQHQYQQQQPGFAAGNNKSVRFHEPKCAPPSVLDLENGNLNSGAEVIANPHPLASSPNGSPGGSHFGSGLVIANGYRPLSPHRGNGTLPLAKGRYKNDDGSSV